MTEADFDGCALCLPPGEYVGRGEEDRFPPAWKRLGSHPSFEAGAWAAGLWYCTHCGAIWSAVYDQYAAYYWYERVPEGDIAALRRDARPAALLRLADRRAFREIASNYFQTARCEAEELAHAFASALGETKPDDIDRLWFLALNVRRALPQTTTPLALPRREARRLSRAIQRAGLLDPAQEVAPNPYRASAIADARAIMEILQSGATSKGGHRGRRVIR